MLEALKHSDEQLGYTAEQARLSPKSRGQGTLDAAVTLAILRDARLRAADKNGLPEPDIELFRQSRVVFAARDPKD